MFKFTLKFNDKKLIELLWEHCSEILISIPGDKIKATKMANLLFWRFLKSILL